MKTLEHLNVNVNNVSDSTGQNHHHSQALIDCKFSATRDWNIICPARQGQGGVWYGHCPHLGTAGPDTSLRVSKVKPPRTSCVLCLSQEHQLYQEHQTFQAKLTGTFTKDLARLKV